MTLQFFCLFLAIWLTLTNSARFIRGQRIEALGFGMQALGIAGFIYLTWC